MAFQEVKIVKVDNGYVVSVTEMNPTPNGWQPDTKHSIAKSVSEAVDLFYQPKDKPDNVVQLK